MSGSTTTVRWLLSRGPPRRNLHLLVHPVAVGKGLARLFPRGRAEHPPRAAELGDLQDRRAEPQLRPGQGLTAAVSHSGSFSGLIEQPAAGPMSCSRWTKPRRRTRTVPWQAGPGGPSRLQSPGKHGRWKADTR